MKLLRKIQALFRKRKLDAEMAEEMRLHLEQRTRENLERGLSPEDARYAALRKFGGVEQAKEIARDQRGFLWLEQTGQDIRYAGRQLRKSPVFTTVVVLTLALGIGANTAVFTVVDALMLRALPVREPERLVIVNGAESYARFDQVRGEVTTLSGIFAVGHIRPYRVLAPDLGMRESESATVQEVSGNFFAVLEQPAWLGRPLGADDDRAGAPRAVMVMSHAYWDRRFHRDPAVLGRTIVVNNVAVAIVGVMPPEFFGVDVGNGRAVDLWCPLWLKTQLSSGFDAQRLTTFAVGSTWLRVMGRLQPGISLEQARAELEAISERDRLQAAKGEPPPSRLRLQPGATGYTWMRGQFRQPLNVLWAAAGIVLLVACANVAGLLLARGANRQREFAVRLAMGAGRARLVRQLIVESLLVALLGGAAGVVFAMWGVTALGHYIAGSALDLRLHPLVLAFATLVAVTTGLVFGLAPALRFSRLDLPAAFNLGSGATAPGRRPRLGRALVVAQIALSFVLLAGAGLFVRTLQNLRAHDPGFARDHVLQFTLALDRGPTLVQRDDIQRRVLDALEALPGVRSATISQGGMLGTFNSWTRFSVEGVADDAVGPVSALGPAGPGQAAGKRSAVVPTAGRRYFETKGIPLVRGRDFTVQDEQPNAPRVVVISEALATKYFPDTDPIGRVILLNRDERHTIVGVARDAQFRPVRDPIRDPAIYLSYFQRGGRELNEAEFTLRTQLDPRALGPSLRAAVKAIAPEAEIVRLGTVAALLEDGFARERAVAELAGFFSVLTLLLAGIGLYGVLAYGVTQRAREFGVRMALGAQVRDVLRLVIGEGIGLVAVGCVLGALAAAGLTRFVVSLLYDISPGDPLAFGAAVPLLGVVALFACWLPARRATKVDPVVALRSE